MSSPVAPRSPEEARLAQLLVQRGLVAAAVIQQALAQRDPQDPRPLPELLHAAGALSAEALQQLRALSASGRLPATRADPSARLPASGASGPASGRLPASGGSGPASGRLPATGAGSGPASGAHASASGRQGLPRSLALPNHEVLLEGVLGQGGMGVVYKVRDRDLGRVAALKLIRGQQNPRRARRFQREVLVTACLDHPNIPPVYEAGRTSSGEDYMLMRFVDGRELTHLIEELREDPAGERELLSSLVKVGEAIAYAHSRGVIHRDLKPANVMVGAFGEVLVMDWGLARLQRESAAEDASLRSVLTDDEAAADGLTADGAFVGTPGYMPPEQARGQDVDARSDVFALGAILCEALTGELPVRGDTVLAILGATGDGRIAVPPDPEVPGELRAVAEKALAADPDARYPTAEAFTADLRAYLEGRPVSVYRYRPTEQALRTVRSHPALFSAIGVAFVLSLVAVYAMSWAGTRAREAVQQAAAETAREEAVSAWEQLQQAPRPELPERIGQALSALQAAQRRRTLAPDDWVAAGALFDAALALGDVASDGEQWALARQAYSQAIGLGVDDSRAQIALARVDEQEHAEAKRRREAIQALLAEAERGELGQRSEGFLDAAFLIGRYPDAQTVELLAQALESVCDRLTAAERALYLSAFTPSDDDRALEDTAELVGLAEALEHQAKGVANFDERRLLDLAESRLVRRARAGQSQGEALAGSQVSLADVVAKEHTRAVSVGTFDLARLACLCLGRLGISERAVGALARYLEAETDPSRAAMAGLALCRLGAEGERLALEAVSRFGEASAYAVQLGRALRLARGESPAPEAPAGKAATRVDTSRIARAARHRVRGELDQAIRVYDEALAEDPQAAWALVGRGKCLADQGLLLEAAEDFSRAVAGPVANPEAHGNRGALYLRMGQLEDAQRDALRALELDPGQAEARLTLAALHTRKQEWDAAREHLDRLIEAHPQLPVAWLRRAEVWVNAIDNVQALADVERALELDPNNPRAYVVRGCLRTDMQSAGADFLRALELDPRCPSAKAGVALHHLSRTELGDAQRLAEEALAVDPDQPEALAVRAMCLMRAGKLDEGRACWDRAEAQPVWSAPGIRDAFRAAFTTLQGQPGAGVAATCEEALVRGSQRMVAEDFQGARVELDRALELNPKHAQAWYLRALCRKRLDDLRGAIEDLSRALELEDFRGSWWLERGYARYRLERNEQALADYDKAIELEPHEAGHWARRGELKFDTKDYAAAAADLRQALRRDAQHPWAWRKLADVDYALEDWEGVIEDVTRSLEVEPQQTWIVFLRGMAKGRSGDKAGAVADLQEYLRRFPQGPRAKECKTWIKKWS